MSAIRTLLGDRLRCGGELALWIVSASVKRVALARAFFDEFAFFAFGALHADEVLLHIFAVGISAAGSKLAVTAVPQDQVALAQRTGFIERNVGHFFALIEPPRRLAIGIAGAGHELAEAPALQDHDAATVFAVFLLRDLLRLGRVEVGQIDGIFFGELASIRVFLVVGAAGIERTVLAPLDDERRTAEFTLFVGGFLHTLDVFHVLLGVSEILGKLLVKLSERAVSCLLAFFNLVELFFQARGVLEVENVFEVLDQQIGDDQANFGGHELAAGFLRVLPLLDGAENSGVGGRPANAALLEFLHQRSFVEARRRLGEMLLWEKRLQRQLLPGFERRDFVLQFLGLFLLAVLGLFIDLEEAVELHDRSGYAEPEHVAPRLGIDVDRGLVEHGGVHLRSDETLPGYWKSL